MYAEFVQEKSIVKTKNKALDPCLLSVSLISRPKRFVFSSKLSLIHNIRFGHGNTSNLLQSCLAITHFSFLLTFNFFSSGGDLCRISKYILEWHFFPSIFMLFSSFRLEMQTFYRFSVFFLFIENLQQQTHKSSKHRVNTNMFNRCLDREREKTVPLDFRIVQKNWQNRNDGNWLFTSCRTDYEYKNILCIIIYIICDVILCVRHAIEDCLLVRAGNFDLLRYGIRKIYNWWKFA